MTLIQKLRDAIHPLHLALDHSLVPYIESIQSKDDYAALLLLFYGFFKPVYDNIDACIDLNNLPDYPSRRKPEWLLNDLQDLEVDYEIQLCNRLPAITNATTAIGALYVLEGATLGGIMIKKMIIDKLHIHQGLSFFNGYDRHTRERWNVFIQSLNNLNTNNAMDEALIQTAAATFVLFKDWLQQKLIFLRA
ncbi:biliverdin-producing heme oxygenase [Ilyomonas limi]|uniref:Biliverdin-producing heme oxygenase n=1 Tax=Ilyomonas limi TaxID=2575867 RepID=A0A4U3L1I3_9BACT|nr:biliverdin-producing heme oxygenase [Ilyomonas limi]TKK68845.1 biliverdin-producing heme oxygenase [Ilyomonas limi]